MSYVQALHTIVGLTRTRERATRTRHTRLAKPPDRASECPVSTGNSKMDVDSRVGPLESAPPAQLPGHADGTDRRAVAGSGRPACPTAIPTARSCIRVSSLYWELKDGCGQSCEATRVGTPSPASRPCRRHRPTGTRSVRPAGMSDGHPDRPIVHPSVQSLLGTERWMCTVV